MKNTGVIIARFQTPYLHDGHKHLLNEVQHKHNRMVVVLGVSPVKGSRRNPFDFYTREKLLKQYMHDLVVLPLADHPSDIGWSKQLDSLLHSTFPQESFVLYGSRDSFIPSYSGHYPTVALPESGDYSATAIRDSNSDKVLDTVDFRMGINYAYHNIYPKAYPTVDIAVMRLNNSEILLGKKSTSNKWRLPGGFVDPADTNFEQAARRELTEECGALETGNMQYVGSTQIDDWRYRSETDKILTTLFKTELIFGNPQASDDLEEVGWFSVNDLQQMLADGKITEEHEILIKLLLNNLK